MSKRTFDFSVALIASIFLSPLMVAVGVVVLVYLGRPLLFRQKRIGYRGRKFWLYKFRTMSDTRGPDGKLLPDADRLGSIGYVLRSASLDELPQLWNVLRGDMSLVGPRPLLPEYQSRYSRHQLRRHETIPGITGWAQVHGRNTTTWERRLDLDVWYVDHRSFWLDLRILGVTAVKVFRREGVHASEGVTMPVFSGSGPDHQRGRPMPKTNILISSAGRRVALMACLRESVAQSGRTAKVFTIDCGTSAPATFVSDHAFHVSRCTDADFMDQVFQLCEQQQIGLVIPTIDTELLVYATNSGRLLQAGVTVCISSPETIHICNNKIATHQWFVANGFPTVRQTDLASALSHREDWPLPLIAKPCNGSASLGIRRIQTLLDLEAAAESGQSFIVQEVAAGMEFTINVYVNRTGKCVCAVPHWRMEVRAGEVSKGLTFKNAELMHLARTVAEALPGAYGPLNIQGFLDYSGTIKLIEVNARFGGGYPLAHRAGARFTDWLLDELDGKTVPYTEEWTDDLAMLRYDDAVFTTGSRIRA